VIDLQVAAYFLPWAWNLLKSIPHEIIHPKTVSGSRPQAGTEGPPIRDPKPNAAGNGRFWWSPDIRSYGQRHRPADGASRPLREAGNPSGTTTQNGKPNRGRN
jgi:hypothetical protein